MNKQDLSTAEIMEMILGEFDTESNTECALEVFLFAKKINNAAGAAIKLTQELATKELSAIGGKGVNSFAEYSITKSYLRTYQPNAERDFLLATLGVKEAELSKIKDQISEIEKAMEKRGEVKKEEIGKNIKVVLLEKI